MELTITNVNVKILFVPIIFIYNKLHYFKTQFNYIIHFQSARFPVMAENNIQWTQRLFTKLFGFDDV
jgi:hypothetical protein